MSYSSICLRGIHGALLLIGVVCLSDGGLGGVGVFSVWHLHIQAS